VSHGVHELLQITCIVLPYIPEDLSSNVLCMYYFEVAGHWARVDIDAFLFLK
jgi:hypothetical protein